MSTVKQQAWFRTLPPAQKQAWFTLTIILLSLSTVLALTPVLGFQRAQGGLGFLGFLGLTPIIFRKRAGGVLMDERDEQIQLRSWMFAYAVFWVVFVAVCLAAPLTYGSSGMVRVEVIQFSVWYAFMLVWGLSALAALVQYRRGGVHAAE